MDSSTENGVEKRHRPLLWERLGSKLFLGLVFLLPLFVVPLSSVPLEFSKTILVYGVVFVTFALFLLSMITEGRLVFPKTPLLFSAVFLVFVYGLSAILSPEPLRAFIGSGFELDTVLFMAAMGLIVFLTPLLFRTRHAIINVEVAVVLSFFVIALFEIIRLVFGFNVLSLGIFTTAIANPLGAWNDLAVLGGLIALLSLLALEFLPAQGIFSVLLHIALLSSVLMVALVGFPTIWYILGVFAFTLLLHSLVFKQMLFRREVTMRKKLPVLPFGVLVVSLLFVLWGNTIGSFISTTLHIDHLNARPSWGSTLNIGLQTLRNGQYFGAGPNQFENQWLVYKPVGINETVFWNVDFNFGIGLVPSSFTTLGALGVLAWLLFLLILILSSLRGVKWLRNDNVGSYVVITTASGALFLFLIDILYTPGAALYTLSFVFAGLLVASLVVEGVVKEKVFSFGNNPAQNFITILIAIPLLVGSIAGGYLLTEKMIAYVEANTASNAFANQDFDSAEKYLRSAASLSGSDDMYRSLVQVLLGKLSKIAQDKTSSPDAIRTQFQNLLAQTVDAGKSAVALDSSNYLNWLSLGQIYESVVPLNISGAYESAKSAYVEAGKHNPTSPLIPLMLGRLEQANGNSAEAKKRIAEALKLKNNYTDAIFLLSQIEVAQGDIKGAIQSVQAASVLDSTNPVIFFQLGILRYNDKDYKGAASALEQAIALESTYANARYFLGLSYYALSRPADAITQFETIQKTNPDNQEIKLILSNLRAGKAPLNNAKPPIDTKPEKRKALPIPSN